MQILNSVTFNVKKKTSELSVSQSLNMVWKVKIKHTVTDEW